MPFSKLAAGISLRNGEGSLFVSKINSSLARVMPTKKSLRSSCISVFDLFLIAVSLSMDAFAVSICKGLSVRKVSLQHAMICGVWFGGFQFLMPALGYFLGDRFAALLTKFGPWIAFVLLALIGANMIKESFGGDEQLDDDYSAKAMLPLAIATSIDAFAVGVSFAAMQVDILPAAGLIGVITCLLSAIGVKVGAMFGDKYRAPAERIGGIVLILIGVKTLLTGLGVL